VTKLNQNPVTFFYLVYYRFPTTFVDKAFSTTTIYGMIFNFDFIRKNSGKTIPSLFLAQLFAALSAMVESPHKKIVVRVSSSLKLNMVRRVKVNKRTFSLVIVYLKLLME
jgi:hypothetical protein